MQITLWTLSILLILVGIAGTVLPALPGTVLVVAGVVLGAWIDDFTRVSVPTVVVIAIIGVISFASDYVAGAMGAKKVGASRAAVIGALVGTVVGIFTGLWGLIFMPLVGAFVGQYWVDRDLIRASDVGFATWLGMAVGTLAKVILTFLMVAIFIVALVID